MKHLQGRARVDAKGRVSLGRFLKHRLIKDYEVIAEDNGRITLIPLATIPEREQWLYKNPQALKSLRKGIEEVGKGKAKNRGSFAKYVEGAA